MHHVQTVVSLMKYLFEDLAKYSFDLNHHFFQVFLCNFKQSYSYSFVEFMVFRLNLVDPEGQFFLPLVQLN